MSGDPNVVTFSKSNSSLCLLKGHGKVIEKNLAFILCPQYVSRSISLVISLKKESPNLATLQTSTLRIPHPT